MKALKISLIVILALAIAFYLFRQNDSPIQPPLNVTELDDSFTPLIKQKIDSIKFLPNENFDNSVYDKINYLIQDYFQPAPPKYPFGRLGSTMAENVNKKKELTLELYSEYVKKFTEMAIYVFQNSNCSSNDLNFIRQESKNLKSSIFLKTDSVEELKLQRVDRILNEYDKIKSFINECNMFSYRDNYKPYDIDQKFAINYVKVKIDESRRYLESPLNSDMNICLSLRDELEKLPENFFNEHYKYLETKIKDFTGIPEVEGSPKGYRLYYDSIYKPLSDELKNLSSINYNVGYLNSKFSELEQKWNIELDRAYIYYEKNNL